MPIEGERLVIDPSYAFAEKLMAIGATTEKQIDKDPALDGAQIRNTFWSWHWRCDIVVFQLPSGRIDWGRVPLTNQGHFLLKTLMCSDAWGIEQEHRAVRLLGTLLTHRQMRQYLLTGMFLESSKRSGVSYLFRRLRPTLALSGTSGQLKAIAALCMHPIGYYADSWAGAMCPTDDVIAHLALMRGDEAMYWRRSSQHPPWRPAAGM